MIGLCTVLLGVPVVADADQDADDDFAFARNLYRDAGDWDTAARLFADFIRDYPGDPNLPEARFMLARSHARRHRCEAAVRAYAAFFEHHPEHLSAADARRERASCLNQLGQFRQAAQALEEVQQLFSASTFAPEALLEAAANYRQAEDLGSAARVFNHAIDEYSTHAAAAQARYHLAQLRFAQGDSGSALILLEQIDKTAPKSERARDALLLSERILLILNRSAQASEVMDRLVKRFADSAHADSALVDFARYHFTQERFDDAVTAYEKAARRRSSTPGWMNQVHLGLADALRQSEQFDRAVEMYKQVTSQSEAAASTLAMAHLGLATTYSRTGRAREAVPIFLRLIQSNRATTAAASSTSRLVWAMAVRELAALYRHQGDYTRSSVWYDEYLAEAQRQGSTFPEVQQLDGVRLQLAKLYDSSGQSGRAIQLFESLQSASPQLQPDVQRSLAEAFDGAGETNRALHEYRVFLERFPDHNYARRVRERIELLSQFTIRDQEALDRVLRQAWMDDLNGRSRRSLMLDLALTLRQYQDYDNAVTTFETFVASYPDDPDAAQAQYSLAECLVSLARKRELEGDAVRADSLRHLGLEEYRILATKDSPFSRRAQLRLVEVGASAGPDSTRLSVLEAGLTSFLSDSLSTTSDAARPVAVDTRAQALLLLGDTRRQLGGDDGMMLTAALGAYDQLLDLDPDQRLAVRARFGRALCHRRLGREGIVDSLQVLLNHQAGRSLVPDILAELGQALIGAGEPRRAISRFGELLAAFPAYAHRRMVLEQLAATHLQLGEYHPAISQYQRLLDSEPRPERVFELQRRLARAYRAAGFSAEALDLYTSMLSGATQAQGADSLAFNRASLLVELGRLGEAEQAFGDLQRHFPSSPLVTAANNESADLLFELERYDDAHAAYATLVNKGAAPRVVGRAAVALYRLNRLEEGRKLSKGVDDEIWSLLLQLEEGRLYLRGGEYERAQKLFAQIEKSSREKPPGLGGFSERDPDLADMAAAPAAAAGYYLSTSKWQQDENNPSEEGLAMALEAQRRFLADYGDSPQALDVRLRLGAFNFRLKEYLRAAGDFRWVLETPSAPQSKKQEAVWMLLDCYLKAREYADAHRIAARLLKEFPDHPRAKETQLEIGNVLIEQNQYSQAIEHFESVLTWAEGNEAASAKFYIGQALQNMAEYSKAIEAYYRVRFEGADGFAGWITTADYERAQCNEALGQNATARTIYKEIIQREGSDSDFGKEARKQLDRLVGLPDQAQ